MNRKVGSRKINGKHGKDQPMRPLMVTHYTSPYSGHSSPHLQITYTLLQFQPLLAFLSGDGADDILSLYSLAPYASAGECDRRQRSALFYTFALDNNPLYVMVVIITIFVLQQQQQED